MPAAAALPTTGFTIQPNSILLNPSISVEAKSAFNLLKYFDRGHGRGYFAKKETLAHYLSLSPYRLRKALTELVQLSLIEIERRGQGHTDVIRVLQREDDPPVTIDEMGVAEEEGIAEEMETLEVNSVEIQTSTELTPKEDLLELNKTKHTTTKPPEKPKTRECFKLITHFYRLKEDRSPTQNELTNWNPTARRLLDEFTFDELIEATEYAVDQEAKLFYYVALVGPDFIVKKRKEKDLDAERLKHASDAIEAQNEKERQWQSIKENSRVYEGLTKDLLDKLSAKLKPQSFNSFFKDTFISAADQDSITLIAASGFTAHWICEHYLELLRGAVGKKVKVVSV